MRERRWSFYEREEYTTEIRQPVIEGARQKSVQCKSARKRRCVGRVGGGGVRVCGAVRGVCACAKKKKECVEGWCVVAVAVESVNEFPGPTPIFAPTAAITVRL